MGKATGFMEYRKKSVPYRDAADRQKDFREIFTAPDEENLKRQGARCMDCGVPFCQSDTGCPVDNLIPEWNDLVYQGRWREALNRLHQTNNFPEFTGRTCPAPCEGACVLGITDPAVTIKNIENAIIDRGFAEGWVKHERPSTRTGKTVGVVGSGPFGLAAADPPNRAGHEVTVYERADRIGGVLMYGIPKMKLDKAGVDRRVDLMRHAGISFVTNADVGRNVDAKQLATDHDAVLLATGSTQPRDLPIKGRELSGVHFAMDFLTANTKSLLDSDLKDGNYIDAKDKSVIVIGGGDTGSDCVGTSHRQRAKSVTSLEVLPQGPEGRHGSEPWPLYPRMSFTVSSSHEEGGERQYAVLTKHFAGENGSVTALHGVKVEFDRDERDRPLFSSSREVPGGEFVLPAGLVLLALGFLHPQKEGMIEQLAVELDPRGNVKTGVEKMTSVPGVFAAGDMARGQSLVVWAIAEGRQAAYGIDKWLMGKSDLPSVNLQGWA